MRGVPDSAVTAGADYGDPASALLAWWDVHGRRDLPWQQDPTPYRVWVSEVMLQQTQVATVARYYDRFLADFPTLTALADAPLDQVLHRWSGLGYYARARNLHRAAGIVRDRHSGLVPTEFAALADLPGIGRSTAGAILALAACQRHPILDGNVKRVLARYFRVEGYPGDTLVQRQLWELAEQCTPRERVPHYTQAIMDLGATLCSRSRPACDLCPLASACRARAAGVAASLPARKAARRSRPLKGAVMVLAVAPAGTVLLERRPAEGLWGGLWGLPEMVSVEDVPGWCATVSGAAPAAISVRPAFRHAFTHFDLDITPVEVRLAAAPEPPAGEGRWLWYDARHPAAVGLAAPVARLLQSLEPPLPADRQSPRD